MAPKYPYIGRGKQRYNVAKSQEFNVDNGSGTTEDDVILANLPSAIQIISAQLVFTEATDTAGAEGATVSLGTTAGGVDIVAAVALGASKAVGGTQALTLVTDHLASGGTLFARHTGIASTEAGAYFVEVVYQLAP